MDLEGGLLFIGDSLTQRHWEQPKHELLGVAVPCGWYPEILEPQEGWRLLSCMAFEACGVQVAYIQSDLLAVGPWEALGRSQDFAPHKRFCDDMCDDELGFASNSGCESLCNGYPV